MPDGNRCRRSHPRRQLAQHIVVDQGDSDVLVPASLPALRVNLAEQIQFRPTGTALGRRILLRRCRILRGFRCLLGFLGCA